MTAKICGEKKTTQLYSIKEKKSSRPVHILYNRSVMIEDFLVNTGLPRKEFCFLLHLDNLPPTTLFYLFNDAEC